MKFVERRVCSEFFLAVRSVELSPRFFEHLRRFTNVSLWFGARKILVESCRVYGSDDYVFGEEFSQRDKISPRGKISTRKYRSLP